MAHGLSLNINYTYSHNIDDTGTVRSGFAVPASATASGKAWAQDRMDRSLSINSQPQNLSIFGVYKFPFGKGGIGADNFFVRNILGGWETSGIFQYYSGLPLAVTASCGSTQNPGQGTCMPDINPNFVGSPRINGGWGKGVTAATLGTAITSAVVSQVYVGGGLGSTATNVIPCASSTGPFCDSGSLYYRRCTPRRRLRSARSRRIPSHQWPFAAPSTSPNASSSSSASTARTSPTPSPSATTLRTNRSPVAVDTAGTFGTVGFASADSRAFQFSGRLTF